MSTLGNRSTNLSAATRLEVFTNADGDHLAVLVNGHPSEGSLVTSRSMDPDTRAVWLDGERLYDVDLHWNGVYQFTVPADSDVASASGRLKPTV